MSTNQTTSDPSQPTLRRDHHGRLQLITADGPVTVTARACCPWGEPRKHLSLRDAENVEHGFVADPGKLDPASREAVLQSLQAPAFTFEITRLVKIESDFQLREWTVETEQGKRRFLTKYDDWPLQKDDGTVVISDLAGDIYTVRGLDRLDPKSRQQLSAFVG